MFGNEFRAPAVPLITNDPFFSVWSFADRLTDDVTRHWTGARQYMTGIVSVDGELYEFMGRSMPLSEQYFAGYPKMEQLSCEVRPLTTVYTFATEKIRLELKFTSPLLPDDLDVMSRPVSYITYTVAPADGKRHEIKMYWGFSGEFCVDRPGGSVAFGTTPISVYATSGTDNMLKRAEDDHRIEWGSFHVVAPQAEYNVLGLRYFLNRICWENNEKTDCKNSVFLPGPRPSTYGPEKYQNGIFYRLDEYYPTITLSETISLENLYSNKIALCYDDVHPLEYFGKKALPYWKKNGEDFLKLMRMAYDEYGDVLKKVEEFENGLLKKAGMLSPKYAQIISLAFRQAIAGHKLSYCGDDVIFASKENFSNGCACTVDVTYPSMPLFLMYEPRLVEWMLDPVFRMIDEGLWLYPFAPHDVGTYPLLNGQAYGFYLRHRGNGRTPESYQMPVEECGNMILCVAAISEYEGSYDYFKKREPYLRKWANYLLNVGYDPGDQLCTDDFAGHLEHNCNLSVKAICAIGAFGKMLNEAGYGGGDGYISSAVQMASKWEKEALDAAGDHYKLTFDSDGSWSIKYNLVWDKLLGLGLFSERVYELETEYYLTKFNKYGLPLDSRCGYTKSDWQMWGAFLAKDRSLFDRTVDCMWEWLCDTPDRVPFGDWYFTEKPLQRSFQARTVQGGLFIMMLGK